MPRADVIVIGGGISGASFAFHAARAGRSVLWLEREARLGGCLRTEHTASGFWYELGGHTCYNSYGAFIELLEGCELMGELQARGRPFLRFLDGDQVVPGANQWALLRLMNGWQLLGSLPRLLWSKQDGHSVRSFYARIVGAGNYERVLGPMLSAVPSQSADAFPADMLFKTRPRRKDVMRSYTLRGGLSGVVEKVAGLAGVTARTGCEVVGVARAGGGLRVTLADGSSEECGIVATATTPAVTARLLSAIAPDAAARIATIGEATVESTGCAVQVAKVAHLPPSTFLIPLADRFHSIVTRDVVPDPERRAFTFHFRPGIARDERLARMATVLRVSAGDLESIAERRTVLPSPVLGHHALVAAIEPLLARQPIAVGGNWFAGLSIEDCVQRARAEWHRVSGPALAMDDAASIRRSARGSG